MKHQRHFLNTSEAVMREAVQIRMLIANLDRVVHFLDCDIATEEERARVSDHTDVAYPMLARTLATRRDKLRHSIAMLEQRLATSNAAATLGERVA